MLNHQLKGPRSDHAFHALYSTLCEAIHSKNTGVELDPEKIHWGQTPFRVNDDPEIRRPDAEYDTELGQSDPIICQVCRKLTRFRVTRELSMAPMNPFSGHANPGVL